jgi:hypothetical protein
VPSVIVAGTHASYSEDQANGAAGRVRLSETDAKSGGKEVTTMRKILAALALTVALLSVIPAAHAAQWEGRVSDENPYEFVPR